MSLLSSSAPTADTTTTTTSTLKPSQFFNRRVSFDNYRPEIIEPTDIPHTPSHSYEYNTDDFEFVKSPSPHLKPILKKTVNEANIPRSSSSSSRRLYEIPGTRIKKHLLEMTDEEILLLDSQFAKKQIDVEKNYRFDSDPAMSPVGHRLDAKKESNSGFNCLNMTDYPTKPIIKKNSICLNFRHSKYTQGINSDKFYLILISKHKSSLSAVDFYLENYSKSGDNLVICASISNLFKEDILQQCIFQLVELILQKFVRFNKDLALQINFEFFRNINYMSETLNLYQPSQIIVGCRAAKNKYTSIATSTKNFVSLVYVGTDYKPRTEYSSGKGSSKVTFRTPFADKNVLTVPSLTGGSRRSLSPSAAILSPSESTTSSISDVSSIDGDADEDLQASFLDDSNATFPFLNSVPHLDHISRAEKEIHTIHSMIPRTRAQSSPSLGTTNLATTSTNSASYSAPSSSTPSSSAPSILPPARTGPTVITPEWREKHAMFERYNRRLSSVKIQPQNRSLTFDPPVILTTDSSRKSNPGRRRSSLLLLRTRSKSRSDSKLDLVNSNAVLTSSSSESSPTSDDGSDGPQGFFKKFWKRR
ncbi:hypothetical protein FOA43_000154 [Brettanomyces nanus]|uniref:Uncharacterized protein n=1 Tax=Eeniella nana TaxID=13502 RepID=A0A875RY70_EENNA|nr:uncharacterized protein FOA43_000154 [Brettanomyces nanus]QPG72852.1 hypothetical protein FOA43_000154 [Brettanomyces nanus]